MAETSANRPLARDPNTPFADQLEWLANRYNPGYFLGGTIRPELRAASLGWHAKRVAGAFAISSGAMVLALASFPLAARMPPDPWSLGLGLLSIVAGIRMWRAPAIRPLRPNDSRPGDEGRLCIRVAAMVVLGVILFSAISTVALAAIVVAAMVARGRAGLAAAIAVTIAVVAVRRLSAAQQAIGPDERHPG
jgi:uncharacterized membrane protein YfcA